MEMRTNFFEEKTEGEGLPIDQQVVIQHEDNDDVTEGGGFQAPKMKQQAQQPVPPAPRPTQAPSPAPPTVKQGNDGARAQDVVAVATGRTFYVPRRAANPKEVDAYATSYSYGATLNDRDPWWKKLFG